MSGALLADWLPPVARVVSQRLGLHFPRERWPDLLRGVNAAARQTGSGDAGAFARRVLSAADDAEPLQALADALTIGETYFFRDLRSFEVLRDEILPALIDARRSGSRRLRFWSAGCCTGEEAYSLAILLDRLLPEREGWNVSILGTDVNRHFLRNAARAEYGEWSFREAPPWLKEGYFTRGGGQRYALLPRIRRMVRFAPLNLAELQFPSLSSDTGAMDLILCRNVLMYFSAERMRRVVERLQQALADGGWLSVSAAELAVSLFRPLRATHFDGAVFYRRTAAADEADAAPLSVAPAPRSLEAVALAPAESPLPLPHLAPPHPPALAEASPQFTATPDDEATQLLRLAREHADAGRLALACAAVERAGTSRKLDAGLHHLHAVILDELGRRDDARAAFRRALYLEPDFVLAHHALGQLALRQGRRAEAEHHFGNVLELLDGLADGDVLPRSEGLAAGRLKVLVEAALARGAGR